jgi:hypothetical protein
MARFGHWLPVRAIPEQRAIAPMRSDVVDDSRRLAAAHAPRVSREERLASLEPRGIVATLSRRAALAIEVAAVLLAGAVTGRRVAWGASRHHTNGWRLESARHGKRVSRRMASEAIPWTLADFREPHNAVSTALNGLGHLYREICDARGPWPGRLP